MSTLTVELGERSYPILIETDLLNQANLITPFLKSKKAVVVTNDVVKPLLLDTLLSAMPDVEVETIVLPDGEQHKNLENFEHVISK